MSPVFRPPSGISRGLLILLVAVSTLLSLPSSYQATILSQPEELFLQFTNESVYNHFGIYLDRVSLVTLWGFMVASGTGFAAVVGSFTVYPVVKRYGIRFSLFYLANACSILGAICQGLAKPLKSFELFYLGQVVNTGFAWSLVFTLAPLYLAECSPPDKRGLVGSSLGFGVYTGVLLAYWLGLPEYLGSKDSWHIYVSLTALPSALCLLFAHKFPHSPKDLYIHQNDIYGATRSVQQLYGHQWSVTRVFEDFEEESRQTSDNFSVSEIMQTYHLRQPMIIAVVANVYTVVCGPFLVYLTSTFKDLQISNHSAQWISVFAVLPLPVVSLLASVVIERWGRRYLLIRSGTIMTACLVLSVIFASIAEITSSPTAFKWAAVACLLLNGWIAPLGPVPVGFLVAAEMVPQSAKTAVSTICMVALNIVYMLVAFIYPILQEKLGIAALLWTACLPSVFCLGYLYRNMPETKGLQTNEVVNFWIKREKFQTA